MRKKKIVIPHEHGGWAMVSVPFLTGMAAGTPQWIHLPLFIGWLLLYLASYPLLQAVKRASNRDDMLRWGAAYGAGALLCLLPPLVGNPSLLYFGIPLAALLAVNVWHSRRKSERALLNDLCAILSFSLAAGAAYLAGGGSWGAAMTAIVLFNFLYFTGTAFFVKTVFRERLNARWVVYAQAYHICILAVPWAIGSPLMTVPFVFPALRAFVFAGKPMKPAKVGMLEIVGALQFLILTILLFS
ncbi:YwiC-like family protein [Cohnella hongkongensis]|uniref:YwiC-like family protein n=1 Tax=Cohnella hongkongensis TaxID=178337 RepID=A0ABV9F7N0_9BACL